MTEMLAQYKAGAMSFKQLLANILETFGPVALAYLVELLRKTPAPSPTPGPVTPNVG